MGTLRHMDCLSASISVLNNFTDDELINLAGSLFLNGTTRMLKLERATVPHKINLLRLA